MDDARPRRSFFSSDQISTLAAAVSTPASLPLDWEARARPHLASGELVECLASWCAPEDWLYLYYPTRKHISAGMRAVVEALRV